MTRVLNIRGKKTSSGRFESLMQPHFDALYRSARRFAMNDSDAEDLVQDVCMKAYVHIDELQRVEYPLAWLLRVLYHTFVDARRSQSRSPTDLGQSIDQDDDIRLAEATSEQPEEQVDRMMRVERVLAAMALLDKELCTLVALHDVDGLSIAELSALTNLPQGTIKSRIFRTRAKLGRLLQNKQLRSVNLRIVGSRK